jgi:3-isopropylmalate/(R)-2-methylmalate dehydratase small subunit
MVAFISLTSRVIALPVNDIDTDQIIPARFLKVTDKTGLGQQLFCDWRYLEDGAPNPDFALNRSEHRGAQVLLAGDNFGCGSSREHAPWALVDFGLRAVLSTSFADIFRNNALKNGLLPVVIDTDTYAELLARVRNEPSAEVTIDLETQVLILPSGRALTFPIDPFAKRCLLEGTDELGYLMSFEDKIAAYERRHL